MVSLPDPRDFGNGRCSVKPCLQSARLKHHTSPLKPSCCLQKINLNVFLSICQSMRLCPVIIKYFRSLKNKTWSYSGPDGLQSHSETTHASSLQYSSCLGLSRTGHRRWPLHVVCFHLHLFFCFHFLRFFLFYFLPFIFISSVLVISLFIKRNFLYSNKNKLKAKYSYSKASKLIDKTAFLKFSFIHTFKVNHKVTPEK